MMNKERKRIWKRWVECFHFGISVACEIARANGLEVLEAWKPDINCYHHLLLKGTLSQMRIVEDKWMKANGQGRSCCHKHPTEVYSRKPRGGWPIPTISMMKFSAIKRSSNTSAV